jgi:hypothetical protein
MNIYQKGIPINQTATIAASGTTSGAVDLGGTTLVELDIPATFTGTSVTFLKSNSLDGTYAALRDGLGNNVTLTVAQGLNISAGNIIKHLLGVRYIKVVSGSTEGAERVIGLVSRVI